MLAAMVALLVVAAAAPALAQPDTQAKVNDDVFSNVDPKTGIATAKAGATQAQAVPQEKPPPPPPPKAAPPPPPGQPPAPKQLPASGGVGSASLLGLGVGALLVGGGLLARRMVR